MNAEKKRSLEQRLVRLEGIKSTAQPKDLEAELVNIVDLLLREEDYGVNYLGGDVGRRYFASPEKTTGRVTAITFSDTIAIACRLLQPSSPEFPDIETIWKETLANGHDRLILLSDTPFSLLTQDRAGAEFGARVQLKDLHELWNWVSSVLVGDEPPHALSIRKSMRALAKAIASRGWDVLKTTEWRDLERLLREVFEAAGFFVTLTRPAKDGGFDLELECSTDGGGKRFICEVKHWTSGKRVLTRDVRKFLRVIMRERSDAGLFLSTSGFAPAVFESLTEFERPSLRLGDSSKILGLCKTFARIDAGLFLPEDPIQVLNEGTF